MNTYIAFYKNQHTSSYEAQTKAAALFKAKRSYEVTVVLAARPDGTPVVHTADF